MPMVFWAVMGRHTQHGGPRFLCLKYYFPLCAVLKIDVQRSITDIIQRRLTRGEGGRRGEMETDPLLCFSLRRHAKAMNFNDTNPNIASFLLMKYASLKELGL